MELLYLTNILGKFSKKIHDVSFDVFVFIYDTPHMAKHDSCVYF